MQLTSRMRAYMRERTISDKIAAAVAILLSFGAGLATNRILYEWLFPRALWLGRPIPAIVLAIMVAFLGWILWRRLVKVQRSGDRLSEPHPQKAYAWRAVTPFMPLLLNLVYLFDPAVNLTRSRFLYFCALWLAMVFLSGTLSRPATWKWLGFVLLIGFLLPIYLLTMGRAVGTADTFEFQVVIPKLGIVHPTGYPLYILLSKPFSFLPFNSVAWRINLATAVFGLGAICLLFLLTWRLIKRPVPAVLAAALFGLTPTFWHSAVEAEVYGLHALIVAGALLLMREIGDWGLGIGDGRDRSKFGQPFLLSILLAFALGLGLANHLTTVILIPPALLTVFFAYRSGGYRRLPISPIQFALALIAAFLGPLLLYAYLPLRWAAVNGEAMGIDRFIDWVIGGRFQGALQLTAWLKDATRYEVVGRLLLADWLPSWLLIFAFLGAIWLFYRQWRFGLILFLTWLGYVFYALNYYVPDLAVFLIPAHLVMAIWWGVGMAAIGALIGGYWTRSSGRATDRTPLAAVVSLALFIPLLVAAAGQTWAEVDQSLDDGRSRWGQAVLELPLTDKAAILADSDKFPPLYYLQQAEGQRSDLDITVLPDEAAYRAELDARLDSGQPVYLARFLPGLEGIYHLRSQGPLTEVSAQPLTAMPPEATASDLLFDSIQLLGFSLSPSSPYAAGETAVTFYWQAAEAPTEVLHVYVRWTGDGYNGPISSQHPANNTYPTVAWEVGEVVADFHTLPRPIVNEAQIMELQVALDPPFTPNNELAWQTLASVTLEAEQPVSVPQSMRAQLGHLLLDGAAFPGSVRPQTELPLTMSGYGQDPEQLVFTLQEAGSQVKDADFPAETPIPNSQFPAPSFIWTTDLVTDLTPGRYQIQVAYPGTAAVCGWMASKSAGCLLGEVEISGVPLPDEASNFENKIALLSVEINETDLRPGDQLAVNLVWQALAPMDEDYTVFVQVLDAQDRIAGQVDSWPLQGTFPTSQWQPGEIVQDPYLVQLDPDLPPGPYRLQVGWYLLETLRRLPVLDDSGTAVDDKVVVPGLRVP